ncbi:hypothetical protein U9M48_038146 [Paspalum notatum var. saurae]|uniref:Uncharacterized protein n=1 Tax=Paspalum notatum var. saurae TaxID=547442 RepID=A0AAQ3XBD0_PASNO
MVERWCTAAKYASLEVGCGGAPAAAAENSGSVERRRNPTPSRLSTAAAAAEADDMARGSAARQGGLVGLDSWTVTSIWPIRAHSSRVCAEFEYKRSFTVTPPPSSRPHRRSSHELPIFEARRDGQMAVPLLTQKIVKKRVKQVKRPQLGCYKCLKVVAPAILI